VLAGLAAGQAAAEAIRHMIEVDKLSKWYGDFQVLDQCSTRVAKGEVVVICGPSGSGKSTLIKCINGLEPFQQGAVTVNGVSVGAEGTNLPKLRASIGMVFQNFELFPHMTVLDNICLAQTKVLNRNRAEAEERAMQLLNRVGLADQAPKHPAQLSGGQQQRVALARTLVIQPRALLLDEPLSNLDAKLRAEMRIELLKLQRDLGITTIYVTHDQEEALALSTRIAVMESGRVVQEGEPREIYEQPREKFVAEFVGKSNLFIGAVARAGDGVIEVKTEEGLTIRAAFSSPLLPGAAGKKVLLNIRPEAIDLLAPGEEAARLNRIAGKVAALAYQGSFVEYEIEAGGRPIKANIINPKGKRLFQRGEEVAAVFDPKDVALVRQQG